MFLSSFTLLNELAIPVDSLFAFTHIQSLNQSVLFLPLFQPLLFHISYLDPDAKSRQRGRERLHKIIFLNLEIKYYNFHLSIQPLDIATRVTLK